MHRRDTLRASKIMQQRAFANPKISFIWDSTVEDIFGERTVTGVKLRNLVTDQTLERPCDAVFVAIGHEPITSIFAGQLELDKKGYIISPDGVRTGVPGVFVAGDVQDTRYRQAVTAAGLGCRAAMDAEKFLEAQHAAPVAAR
jgi:thioredoxin reductase (NADPH)